MNNDLATSYDDSCFSPNCEKIAELNDNFRKTFSGGYVMTSNGIVALGPKRKWEIIKKVKETPKKYPRMFSKIKKSPYIQDSLFVSK